MKLKNRTPERTLEIIDWLIENVGERIPGTSGSSLLGYGWSVHYNEFDLGYDIRLDCDNVDEETQLLFMLTCA